MAMEIKVVEIIHREKIKPSSPTPNHLRDFKLSLFDQLAPVMYTPLLLFYPTAIKISIDQQPLISIQHLRKTLSQTLTHFYPLAGRLRGNLYIECNDEGAEFLEARINCSMSETLENPDSELLRQFLPTDIECKAADMEFLLLVQVTLFQCGGMAIGLSISHKITDASTLTTFVNAWAGMAIGSDPVVLPEFGASSLFPPLDMLSSKLLPLPVVEFVEEKCKTSRYVFDARKIAALQSKAASPAVKNPTRVEAVSAVIWKCAMEASRSNSIGPPKQSFWCQNANIRKRVIPPLPENLVGNLVGYFAAKTEENEALDLQNLVAKMRKGIEEVKEKYEKGIDWEKTKEELKEYGNLIKNEGIENYNCTSWCRFPFYKADFGWGKPSWVSISGVTFKNVILLMDTKDEDGIEAWLVFREEDMAIVESNRELLAYATLNPSLI